MKQLTFENWWSEIGWNIPMRKSAAEAAWQVSAQIAAQAQPEEAGGAETRTDVIWAMLQPLQYMMPFPEPFESPKFSKFFLEEWVRRAQKAVHPTPQPETAPSAGILAALQSAFVTGFLAGYGPPPYSMEIGVMAMQEWEQSEKDYAILKTPTPGIQSTSDAVADLRERFGEKMNPGAVLKSHREPSSQTGLAAQEREIVAAACLAYAVKGNGDDAPAMALDEAVRDYLNIPSTPPPPPSVPGAT